MFHWMAMLKSVGLWIWKVVLAELYADFVPRWLKRPVLETDHTVDRVLMLSTALKLPFAMVLIYHAITPPVNPAFKQLLGTISIYLLIDFTYQMFDIGYCANRKILRQSATLIVDVPFYLFWFGWRRVLAAAAAKING